MHTYICMCWNSGINYQMNMLNKYGALLFFILVSDFLFSVNVTKIIKCQGLHVAVTLFGYGVPKLTNVYMDVQMCKHAC